MWFTRTVAVVVASVFMMLICHSESKPQAQPQFGVRSGLTDNLSNDDLINSFIPKPPGSDTTPGGDGECKCVPIEKCCDPLTQCSADNLIDCVDDRTVCPDLLSVCCDNECPVKVTADTNQCGIRNPNGVRVTVAGFKEGQAQFGEFPWMVAVQEQLNKKQYVGGGSLIHKRVVVTAAHKVYAEFYQKVLLEARIGDWNLADEYANEPIDPHTIKIEKIVIHPEFQRNKLWYDVALLILETDAVLSESVMPICLPKSGQIFDGADCILTGWGGDVYDKKGDLSKIMKKISVPAISQSECQTMLRRHPDMRASFELHKSFNCAGGEGEDACDGDGGSPLVCPNPNVRNQYVQMGVVAWGIGCGVVGNPGVYGSIPETVDWIIETINNEFPDVDERLPQLG